MHNTQYDSRNIDKPDLPYNKTENPISELPRLVDGANSVVSLGGTLLKRYNTLAVTNGDLASRRIDRLWIVDTMESPPKLYVLASAYNSSTSKWQMYYMRLNGGSWTSLGSTRDIDASTRPHECVISRGIAYIKGFPNSSEKLGTVAFDGSGPTVRIWGLLGSTTPVALDGKITRITAAISSSDLSVTVSSTSGFPAVPFVAQIDYEQVNCTALGGSTYTITRGYNGTTAASHDVNASFVYRNWSASTHIVDVNYGWKYVQAYKTSSGHYSNITPLETNPDKLPSTSGPFTDLIPKFTLTGHADTTNITHIAVFRSTDGGGKYFLLKEVTNTGAGSITFSDTYLESGSSGGTFSDPTPDKDLDLTSPSPSLTSNSPPPTVLPPLIVGTDTPAASSPIDSYSARLWYFIGNVLFYSAQDELDLGIPEEAWPSGLKGNFFRFQYPGQNLQAISDSLYLFTTRSIHQITGTNRESFNPRIVSENTGAPYGHPRAVCKFGSKVAFVSHDYRICLIEGNSIRTISDPLFDDITSRLNTNMELDLEYFADREIEWLVVAAHRKDDPTLSRQWVYDIKKSELLRQDFWNCPWTIRSTAMIATRLAEGSSQNKLVFSVYNATANKSALVYLDTDYTTGTDTIVNDAGSVTTTSIDFYVTSFLCPQPPGNHVNALRVPALSTTLTEFSTEEKTYSGQSAPTYSYYIDDLYTTPTTVTRTTPEDGARRNQSLGYGTWFFKVNKAGRRFAIKISKLASSDRFELLSLTFTFTPDSGA